MDLHEVSGVPIPANRRYSHAVVHVSLSIQPTAGVDSPLVGYAAKLVWWTADDFHAAYPDLSTSESTGRDAPPDYPSGTQPTPLVGSPYAVASLGDNTG